MEFFEKAQFVRLRSHLGSYLCADGRGEAVSHGHRRDARSTMWAVERAGDYVRLLSHCGLHLGATDIPSPLDGGAASCRVRQGAPANPNDNAFLWSPRRDGLRVVLCGPFGRLLRANVDGTVTVDFNLAADGSFWVVEDVVPAEKPGEWSASFRPRVSAATSLRTLFPPAKVAPAPPVLAPAPAAKPPACSLRPSSTQAVDSWRREWQRRPEPRKIFYNITGENGAADGLSAVAWRHLTFGERSLEALRRRLGEAIGRSDFIVCRQCDMGERLFPLVLDLPPGRGDMELVLVLELSRVSKALKWPNLHGLK